MNAPAALYAIRWLIRDTFRQARASGLLWLMLGVTGICILLCLSISVEGPATGNAGGEDLDALPLASLQGAAVSAATVVLDGFGQTLGAWPVVQPVHSVDYRQVQGALAQGVPILHGRISLLFGAISDIPMARDRVKAVRALQLHLAAWVADAAGLLLALVWTAGFLPVFLEPGSISVLLAKPVPRWSLLAGKCLGVLVFVGCQALLFILGTWLALAVRTGVWDPTYLWSWPLLLLHFAVFFGFSALLATATRSTVACVFGSVLFWLLCWGLNYGRHYALLTPELRDLPALASWTLDAGYWLLPKPLDFHFILTEMLGAREYFGTVLDQERLAAVGAWHPELSLLASGLSGLAFLVLAAWDFLSTDY